MRLTKYAKSQYCILTHNRFKLFFTLVTRNGEKEAHIEKLEKNVSISKLVYTEFKSLKLTPETAKTYGKLLIKLSELLEKNN